MALSAISDTVVPYFVDKQWIADNPHVAFAALRPEHPVIRLDERHYMALRADDVFAMLMDPRTKQVEGEDYVRLNRIPDGCTARLLSDLLLFANGDAHKLRRTPFMRAFARRPVEETRPRIREAASHIVAQLPRDGEIFDFVDRMAARVPAEMIAAILGLPAADVPYFSRRVYSIAKAVAPVYPHTEHAEIEEAAAELFDYVEEQLRRRMKAPRGDLLSTLAVDWQADPLIPLESLVHQVLAIIVGGTDTTRAAFAMLVSLLLQHPDQWDAVKADPALMPGAVSEALRYEPSVGSIARFTTEPVEIGGVPLPAGVMLRVSTMSAMRDPALYARPNIFDIRRTDHPRLHLVFGRGPHRCIGEMLARVEMEESLAALVAGVPGIELLDPPRMLGFGGIRQITPMQVRIVRELV